MGVARIRTYVIRPYYVADLSAIQGFEAGRRLPLVYIDAYSEEEAQDKYLVHLLQSAIQEHGIVDHLRGNNYICIRDARNLSSGLTRYYNVGDISLLEDIPSFWLSSGR